MSEDLPISRRIVIPGRELEWTAARSGGPGGQNVNKVNTKVDLRFDLARTEALPTDVAERMRALFANRLDAAGRLVSDASRSQANNLVMARARLEEMVRQALTPPKRRRKTRPSKAAKARRVQDKRQHAEKKASRGKISW